MRAIGREGTEHQRGIEGRAFDALHVRCQASNNS